MAAACIALLPALAHAQETPTRLVGRVLRADGQPIGGASVRIHGSTAITDRLGSFLISPAPSGRHPVQFEMIGFQTRLDSVTITDGRTTEIEVRMSEKAIELPPLTVSVRTPFLERNGFYDRLNDRGIAARFLTRAEIERKNPMMLTDLFRDVAGAKVHRLGVGRSVVRFTRSEPGALESAMARRPTIPGCEPYLYIDGRLHSDRMLEGRRTVDDFNVVNPTLVEAIEIYVGNTPIEFRGEGCGAILIWTRRAG
jgi:hypothetical protein